MSVETDFNTKLLELGYPVYKLMCPTPVETYIVWQTINEKDVEYADDKPITKDYYFMVHIYSKINTDIIKDELKDLMEDTIWERTGGHDMNYDPTTKFYHRIENFYYYKEV